MSTVPISGLPASPGATLADIFPMTQSGTTYKESLLQVQTLFNITSSSTLQLGNLGLGSPVVTSSILSLTSTTLGFLPPSMTTTQKNAIASPASGLMVYDNTLNQLQFYNGSAWITSSSAITYITGTAAQVLVNGTSGSPQTGPITLTLPQSIATTSSVTFANVTATSAVSCAAFQLSTSPSSGYVLISDGSGNGSWAALSSIGVTDVTGTVNQILASPTTGAVVLSLIGPYTPATYTTNGVLYGNSTSSIQATSAVNDGVLISDNSGVPSFLANSSTPGYVLTANSGAPPSWQALASTGIVTIDGDSGSITGTTVTITGGTSGAVFTGAATTLTESFNYLSLPITTSTHGQILINSVVALQMYGTNNAFVGGAGNFTLTTGSAIRNTAIGSLSSIALTTGQENTACGYGTLANLNAGSFNTAMGSAAGLNINSGSGNTAVGTSCLSVSETGSNNTGIGYSCFNDLLSGSTNTGLGLSAGMNYTGAESNNVVIANLGVVGESNVIRIGTQGTGAGQQNICYMAGITSATPVSANTPQVVLCDSNGNLAPISSSTSGYVLTSNGSATPSFQTIPVSSQFTFVVGGPSATAYTTIQSAITAAALVATATIPAMILINSGTYTENLTLNDFVNLASAGVSEENVFVVGNAVYNSTASGGYFSADSINFTTPLGGGSAFSITGSNACSVNITNCNFNGTTDSSFSSANGNATIIFSDAFFNASAGQSVFIITNGSINLLECAVSSTDTPSVFSNNASIIFQGGVVTDSYTFNDASSGGFLHALITPPASLTAFTIATTASVFIFNATVQSGATYWGTGSGTLEYGSVVILSGGTPALDPALTIVSAEMLSGPISFNNGVSSFTTATGWTDGQLLIGDSSTGALDVATLTAGTGISITNGNGSITIAASGSSTSITGTANQVLANGTSGSPQTGAVTLTFDSGLSIGSYSAITAPTGGIIAPGQIAFGTSTPQSVSQVTLYTSNAYNLYLEGTQTAVDGGSNQFCQLLQPTFSPTSGAAESCTLFLISDFACPASQTINTSASIVINTVVNSNAGTLDQVYGLYITPGTAGAGTIFNSYGAYINTPSNGNNAIALYVDDLAVGYQGIPPPASGAIFSGQVGMGTFTPDASALLDLVSTTQGLGLPSMTTTEKNAISSPRAGLLVFDTTLGLVQVYNGSTWING